MKSVGDQVHSKTAHTRKATQNAWRDPSSSTLVWCAILAWRIFISVTLATTFDPDETYQSLEIAHRVVFGGVGYETWEWKEGVRGFAYPALFVPVYYFLKVFHLDSNHVAFIMSPRVLVACMAWLGDVATWRLAFKLAGPNVARHTLLCSVLGWFLAYCGGRSYTNSLESFLTVATLSVWPWTAGEGSAWKHRIALSLAASACVFRPTNAILWIYLGVILLWRCNRKMGLLLDVLLIALGYVTASVGVDFLYYRTWKFTSLTFLRFNVIEGISLFYGYHPWHWYISQGLPVMLFTFLPFVGHGAAVGWSWSRPALRDLIGLVFWTVACMSCLGHKEFRFLFLLVPPCLVFAGISLREVELRWGWTSSSFKTLLYGILIPQLVLGIYFTQVHKSGTITALHHLRTSAQNVTGVLFLMPCHSTSFYSYMHDPAFALEMIPCDPPIRSTLDRLPEYRDPTTLLYENPRRFIWNYFEMGDLTGRSKPDNETMQAYSPREFDMTRPRSQWPSHIVVYEGFVPLMRELTSGTRYHECARFFNSHFHDDDRQQGDIYIFCNNL